MSQRVAPFCLVASLGLLSLACDRHSPSHDSLRTRPVAITPPTSDLVGASLDDADTATADTVLRLPNGTTLVTGFYKARYLGELPAAHKQPFVVLSGFECSDCDAERSLLVRSPSDGAPKAGNGYPGHYALPGRVKDLDTERLLEETRLFFGRCPPAAGYGVVQFATSYDSLGTPRRTARVADVVGDSLVERELAPPLPAIERTVAAAGSGACREVRPVDRSSEP